MLSSSNSVEMTFKQLQRAYRQRLGHVDAVSAFLSQVNHRRNRQNGQPEEIYIAENTGTLHDLQKDAARGANQPYVGFGSWLLVTSLCAWNQ